MSKKLIYLVLLLVLASFVFAINPRVIVLKLHYDDGNVSIVDSKIKYGFYPDRRYQYFDGSTLELLDEGRVIDSFKFKVPSDEYVDYTLDGELKGGKIERDDFDFGLIIPYYNDMTEIRITSLDGGTNSFEIESRKSLSLYMVLLMIGIPFIILVLVLYGIRKKKQ